MGGLRHHTCGEAHQTSKPQRDPPPKTNPANAALQKSNTMSGNQNKPASQGQPSGYKKGGLVGQGDETGQQGKGRGDTRRETNSPPPANTRITQPQPGANKARHRAKQTSQRGCVSLCLQNSTPGQGARATRMRDRAHTQHHAPARTTTQSRTPPQRTTAPNDEQAAMKKFKPRSPHGATAAVRMDVCAPRSKLSPCRYKTAAVQMDMCAPGSEPSRCRLRNSWCPDRRVGARQGT